jgi:hypothetical protein
VPATGCWKPRGLGYGCYEAENSGRELPKSATTTLQIRKKASQRKLN